MIAARIGLDRFLVWRLPVDAARELLRGGPPPVVAEDGRAWLLFAAAHLDRVRAIGCPLPRAQVAAWLIPCTLADGAIGNAFITAFSDRLLSVWGMRAVGIPGVRRIAIDHQPAVMRVTGEVEAQIGEECPVSGLEWFARNRCGVLASATGWRRLPLTKRSWSWRTYSMRVVSAFAAAHDGEALCAIDCSDDEAHWGRPGPFIPR